MITYSGFWRTVGLFLVAACVLHPSLVGADSETDAYRVQAYRTSQVIEIDGELNEPDWSKAIPITQLVQVEPDEGEPATQPTEIRILYDDKNIYFGFTCFDSNISELIVNEMRRDGRNIHDNDNVYVLLDTYNDRRSGFFFRVNALGAMQDSAVTNSGESMNRDWDAVWKCDAKIYEDRWTAEFAIPFSQLRFKQSDELAWGINLGREIPRNKEDAIWVPVSKSYGGMAKYRTSDLGRLVGLKGVSPGRHLELLPYILPGVGYGDRESEEEDEINTELDVGLDVKYGITSNLTADLTVNTDFAQVEADQEQVNLTRFSLFFPEKRPFFLEGAGLFDFGIPRASFRRPPPMLLFYSRRIGLEEGSAIPIIAGGKVTGKVGPLGVGVLNVLTDDAQVISEEDDEETVIDVPVTNYSVLRLKGDVLSRSSVGLIAVNKQTEDDYNRAGGVDFTYRPVDSLDFQGMWARTFQQETPEEPGGHNAWSLGGNWRTNLLRLEGSYMDIDENFNPGTGYVRREGIRRIRGEIRYVPWPGKFGIRRIYMGPEIDYILNQDNELETREFSYSNWFEFERGGSFDVHFQRTFERLDEDFEIRDDIVIPLGDYSFNTFSTSVRTDDNRAISGDMRVSIGDFFDGDRRGISADANFKPSGRFGIEADYRFERITLPAGSFDAHLLGTRVVYSHSTNLYAKLFTQLNSDGDVINVNFLLNWIYRPGSDFYLVFNQIYDISDDQTDLAESTVIIKMTYWWNP